MSGLAQTLAAVARRTAEFDFSVWFWGDAIAVDGLLDATELTGDPEFAAHVQRYVDLWAERQLGWVDHLAPGAAILRCGHLEQALALAEKLESAPRSPAGAAPLYRPDDPAYRFAVWVDTLYHEPTFFAALAARTGEHEWAQRGVASAEAHIELLRDPESGLYAQAIDTGTGRLRNRAWGRGAGWVLLGLVDAVAELDAVDPELRERLAAPARDLAERLLPLQDFTGFWRTVLDNREAYLETSATAMIAAAFLEGVRIGLFPNEPYADSAAAGIAALRERIDPAGECFGVSAVTWAQTTVGDDPLRYMTLPTETNVWGQGAALRALAEAAKLPSPLWKEVSDAITG